MAHKSTGVTGQLIAANDRAVILIVDDDRGTRLLLRRAMQQDGYHVAEAANGEECLAAFERLQPDIVLLDGMMPVLDGFETCERLQLVPGGQKTPVLMITSLDDNASVD